MSIYLDLLIGFLQVGCFAFGGAYAAIPIIRDVVMSYGWMSDAALTDIIAIAESTPGPIMVNLATFVGSSQGGLLGAVLATFAVIFPAFLIILLVVAIMDAVLKNRYVKAAISGMTPCIIGIIVSTGAVMFIKGVAPQGSLDLRAVLIAALLIAAAWGVKKKTKKPLSPIKLIILSAVLGMIVYAV